MQMLKLANNATSLLASSIGTVNTTLILTSGTEDLFPTLSPGDWFPVVVVDSNDNHEIMRCTARSGVTLTVQRAQEGTVAKSFAAGSRVDLRVTAAAINAVFDRAYHHGEQAISTITGLSDEFDAIAIALEAKAATSTLTDAGLATTAASITNANDAPLGSFTLFSGTEAQSVAANLPALGGSSSNSRHWNITTFGNPARTTQIAMEIFGVGTGNTKGRMFRRQKHDATWGAWLELATMDKVLALAGGTVTGNVRLDGGLGIGMDPPLVGGLYFYRPSGSPFIVFLGDAGSTGTPVQLGQLRADQPANVIRLTNAGLQDLVSFNLTSRLGTVAGDPVAPLGIATKQYADQRGPKAWVNFNGTGTVAIRSAHNVSSITDLGTGTYQVNFASPMASANYCALAQSATQATGVQLQYQATMTDYLTTSVTVRTGQSGTSTHSIVDNEIVNVAVFGG